MASPALFIYGSLLTRGAGPSVNRLLARHGRCLGDGHMRGRLYQLNGYPGAVVSPRREDKVFGKVIRLRNVSRVTAALDAYEAYLPDRPRASEFIRTRTMVTLAHSGRRLPAWVYLYNGSIRYKRRIATGRYNAARRIGVQAWAATGERYLSNTATASTWAVWGNISTAATCVRR